MRKNAQNCARAQALREAQRAHVIREARKRRLPSPPKGCGVVLFLRGRVVEPRSLAVGWIAMSHPEEVALAESIPGAFVLVALDAEFDESTADLVFPQAVAA